LIVFEKIIKIEENKKKKIDAFALFFAFSMSFQKN